MRFHGYRNDMFLMFLCNHVQYEFIYGMVQILLLSIFINYFMVTVLLKSMYVVYT